jgi:ribosomal protein S7
MLSNLIRGGNGSTGFILHSGRFSSKFSGIFSTPPSTLSASSSEGVNQPVVGTSHLAIMKHFTQIVTKGGQKRDDIISQVNAILRQKYGVEWPIQVAVDSVKPVLKFQRFKHSKQYVPIILHAASAEGIAIRWIVQAAHNRNYLGKRDFKRGLIDELDAVIQGTSSVYQKRFTFHRNPN